MFLDCGGRASVAGVLSVLGSNTVGPRRRLLWHQDLATDVAGWGLCVCPPAMAETRAVPQLLQ